MLTQEIEIMANQYTSSFNHIAKEKFGKSAKALLAQYAEEKITYEQASKMTGVTTGTIRKWCNLCNIFLQNKPSSKKQKTDEDFSLLATKSIFKEKAINIENALSRQWSKSNYGKATC